MRVFVTGASGFVGSALVQRLLKEGFEVNALIRAESHPPLPETSRLRYFYGSLSSHEAIRSALNNSDIVVHAAGVSNSVDEENLQRVNVEGTRTLVAHCMSENRRIRNFIYISSQAAGGPTLNGIARCELDFDSPVTAYGRSKLAGEKCLEQAAKTFPCTILRPSLVYGENDPKMKKIVAILKSGIWPVLGSADKLASISLISLEDLIEAILICINRSRTPGTELFYLSEQKSLTPFEYSQAIQKRLGKKPIRIYIPDPILFGLNFLLPNKVMNIENLRYLNWTCSAALWEKTYSFNPRHSFLDFVKNYSLV